MSGAYISPIVSLALLLERVILECMGQGVRPLMHAQMWFRLRIVEVLDGLGLPYTSQALRDQRPACLLPGSTSAAYCSLLDVWSNPYLCSIAVAVAFDRML